MTREPLLDTSAPADRYRDLWDTAPDPPVLRQFLSDYCDLSHAELGEVVLVDQAMRWSAGGGRRVEEYLQDYPDLQQSESVCIDLIYGELRARCEELQPVVAQDMLTRFPQWRDALVKQLEVIDWFDADSTLVQPTHSSEAVTEPAAGSVAGDPSSLAPLTLDDFRIEKQLGAGGMASVYLATQLSLDKPVAIKIMRSIEGQQEEFTPRFFREARAVAALRHENIVDVHGVGRTHDGCPFLVMDLIEGSNLAERLNESPLPAIEAAGIAQQVAKAVGHAHARGIIHRDIKPGNVMLDDRGRVLLTDFGLARVDQPAGQPHSMDGLMIGTPGYMAPEQIDARFGPMGPPADIYGVGAMLYALLTGVAPYRGTSKFELLTRTASDEPVEPPRAVNPEVPRVLETICLKCLQKQPSHRFASMREVEDALHRARDLLSSGSGESSTSRRPTAILWPWALAAAALVLVAIVYVASDDRYKAGEDTPRESTAKDIAVAAPPQTANVQWSLTLHREQSASDTQDLLQSPGPIRTGDSLRVVARLPAERYAYLYWLGADGTVAVLYESDASQDPVRSVAAPASPLEGLPVTDPAGVEVGVLLTTKDPLASPAKVAALLQRAPRIVDPLPFALMVDRQGVENAQGIEIALMDKLGDASRPVGQPAPLKGVTQSEELFEWLERRVGPLGEVSTVVFQHVPADE